MMKQPNSHVQYAYPMLLFIIIYVCCKLHIMYLDSMYRIYQKINAVLYPAIRVCALLREFHKIVCECEWHGKWSCEEKDSHICSGILVTATKCRRPSSHTCFLRATLFRSIFFRHDILAYKIYNIHIKLNTIYGIRNKIMSLRRFTFEHQTFYI